LDGLLPKGEWILNDYAILGDRHMKKIAVSVLLISILYILAGGAGVIYHFNDPIDGEYFWLLFLRLLAVVGGIFALHGANWARWLLVLWIALHLGFSLFHSWREGLAHGVLLVITIVGLFNGKAKGWFLRNERP
jgi:uncharacterized membrane protein HdeD (DUF308 family)